MAIVGNLNQIHWPSKYGVTAKQTDAWLCLEHKYTERPVYEYLGKRETKATDIHPK
jgi:hypothetical protein